MDKGEYIQRRRKRYLAQTLDHFEDAIVPHLPDEAAPFVDEFKAIVRQKFNALAVDAQEVLALDGVEMNGYAIEQRDKLIPGGRTK